MPATVEIPEELVRTNINRAVGDVFNTMVARHAVPRPVPSSAHGRLLPEEDASGAPQVVGAVGFIGDINGIIYLHFELGFALLCTGHLLGLDAAEVEAAGDEVVNDAIGEITNMTVGSFKNGLYEAGFPCKLTIPSILRGRNFSVEPISMAQRHVFCFECAGSTIMADILMKSGD